MVNKRVLLFAIPTPALSGSGMQVGDELATLSAGLIPAPCSDELLTACDYITAVQKRKDRYQIRVYEQPVRQYRNNTSPRRKVAKKIIISLLLGGFARDSILVDEGG